MIVKPTSPISIINFNKSIHENIYYKKQKESKKSTNTLVKNEEKLYVYNSTGNKVYYTLSNTLGKF